MLYFNTAFSLSMLTESATLTVQKNVDTETARDFLRAGNTRNVANPNHANTLDALTRILGIDVVAGASGARVTLQPGDQVLVATFTPSRDTPRETREYTDAQVASATFSFDLVTVL